MSNDNRTLAAITRRQGMCGPYGYGGDPGTVDWFPASGPVRRPDTTVPTAPHERDHIYQAALKQQQQQRDEG